MATKLKNVLTSIVTKVILFSVFIFFTYYTLYECISAYQSISNSSIPVESLYTMSYTDSDEFRYAQEALIEALYWKDDLSKNSELDNLPLYYYYVEYDATLGGGAVTNISDVTDKATALGKLNEYAAYKTDTNGNWQLIESNFAVGSMIHLKPSSIQRNSVRTYNNRLYYTDNPDYEINNVIVESSADATESPVPFDETVKQANIPYEWTVENPCPTVTVYYGFDAESLNTHNLYWQECRHYIFTLFGTVAALAVCACMPALLLLLCGKKPRSTQLHLLAFDHLWSEVLLALFGMAVILLIAWLSVSIDNIFRYKMYQDPLIVHMTCGGLTAFAAVVLFLFMPIIRQMKAHNLIRNSLIFICLRWCWRLIGKFFDTAKGCFDQRAFNEYPLTKALQMRQNVFMGTLAAFTVLLFLAACIGDGVALFAVILFAVTMAVISYWQTTGNHKTYSEINKGFNKSFEEQMKSERTKTALVTNVSHDLKTPLTSIITYIDLLQKEELSDTARDYVTVLAQKSERLKAIVSDLFDLSKSASGNLPLEMEVLDLKRLLEQTMADMRDKIDASQLTFKVKLPEADVNIYSDGKKLYRVFQNLIDNAIKYSLDGTRVFVSLDCDGELAVASIKNTSADEMDFTADDVLQRFSRGDKSRTGDGSGLGLSIAESFTRACGGDFRVELDGDLFKVLASFPITKEKVMAAPEAVEESTAAC